MENEKIGELEKRVAYLEFWILQISKSINSSSSAEEFVISEKSHQETLEKIYSGTF